MSWWLFLVMHSCTALLQAVPVNSGFSKFRSSLTIEDCKTIHAKGVDSALIFQADDHRDHSAILFMRSNVLVKIVSTTDSGRFMTACRREFFEDRSYFSELSDVCDIKLFYSWISSPLQWTDADVSID